MEAPEREASDDGVNYDGKVVTLDLAFLFSTFLRDGAEVHMRVIKGIPQGANAVAGGISNGSLIIVFDTEVPEDVWFEDLTVSDLSDTIINPQLN